MHYKYQSHLEALACDLKHYSERHDRAAFCWAFPPITDGRNFIPRSQVTGINQCEGWALSFFQTEQQAKSRLKELMQKNQKLYLKLGTHIAYGKLNKENGVSENGSSNGHFNHHEYTGNNFADTFLIGDLSYM